MSKENTGQFWYNCTSAATSYPPAVPNPNFAALEQAVLARWQQAGTFKQSLQRHAAQLNGASNEFVFYDGPPFANGLPHYGHLVTGYVKDLIPRYQTMRGRHVDRRFGWDCHGLPAELEVEKELGISGAKAIIEFGIDKFNAACQSSVMKFTQDWEWYVTRQGRWVAFDNDYKTMDRDYMESVLWAFKQLWDKDLVYQGYRVVPYSWAVQTPLSISETRLDNAYRERTDPTLTVGFALLPNALTGASCRVLAWTTTPWTLPSNMALCVNDALTYVLLQNAAGAQLVLAEAALARYERELKDYSEVKRLTGAELVGLRYAPLFPYFADKAADGAFKIISADFVEAESGTGIVHIAPGFGEEDMNVAQRLGIPIVVPVDEAGKFTAEVADYVGQNVILEANANVIKDLKAQGAVLKHDQIVHSYPHCWRTDQPLIYKAVSSWYVAVSKFKDRMVELNQGISWVPAHVKDGAFGNWLANARDWNISRNRFWGAPLPVWQSDDPAYPRMDVYGSIAELERDFGVKVDDLHRPFIDTLTRPNPNDPTGKSTMRRVPEVLDCWFESGAMPFAQLHYPFENQQRFEDNFPGDFIVEYVAQTRGWFYTLMVLSTALFDRAPFKNCICHGVVLDENNQKLSKRLKNYPDLKDVFNQYGADALRWYLLSSPLMVGGDLAMNSDGGDIAKSMRSVILRLWNAYSFFTLYANVDGITARLNLQPTHKLDVYLISKLNELVANVQQALDAFDIPAAYNAVPDFIEALNNWYIRNRRPAFWSDGATAEERADKQSAYDTLYTALVYACRVLAPLLPMLADHIHTALAEKAEGLASVHLADWPELASVPFDADVAAGMDLAWEACSAVLKLREQYRRRVRLPLQQLIIAHPNAAALVPYADLIKDAVNVVDVVIEPETAKHGTPQVKVNSKLGARLGTKFKDVLAAQKSGDWQLVGDELQIAGITLPPVDFELRIAVADGVTAEAFDRWQGLVVLDTTIYPELEREGWARDLIRLIQQTRKDKNLVITDRIAVQVQVAESVASALQPFAARIAKETLAAELNFITSGLDTADATAEELGDAPVLVKIEVVN